MYIHFNFIQKDSKKKPERGLKRRKKEKAKTMKGEVAAVCLEGKTLRLANLDLQKYFLKEFCQL